MSTKPNPATELPLPELSRAWRPLLAEALANDLAGFVRAAWPILRNRPVVALLTSLCRQRCGR